MSDPKNIELEVKVKGSDEAANQVGDVSNAFDDLAEASSNPMAMPTELLGPERTDEIKDQATAVENLSTKTAELTEEEIAAAEAAGKATKEFTDQSIASLKAEAAAKVHAESLKRIEMAGRAMVALQTADFLQQTINKLREATTEGGALHDQLGGLETALEAAEGGLGIFTAGIGTFISTGNAAAGVAAGMAAGVAGVTAAYQDMIKADAAAANARRDLVELPAKLAAGQKLLREQSLINDLQGFYAKEADELERQERALKAINGLRHSLADLANVRAETDLNFTQRNGGDVANAQANVLLTKLNGEIQTIQARLQETNQRVSSISTQAESARVAADQAGKVLGDQSNEYIKLNAEAERLAKVAQAAVEARPVDLADLRASQEKVILRYENELAQLEKDLADSGSPDSKDALKTRDKIYQQLKDYSAGIVDSQTKAISEITVEAGAVTGAANEKAQEVKAAFDSERDGVVNTILNLAPSKQSTDQIITAIKQVEVAQQNEGQAIISALNLLSSGFGAVVTQLADFKQDIQGKIQQLNSSR